MTEFELKGTATFKRKFSIKIAAPTYERAEEKAFNLLKDVDDHEYFEIGNEDTDIDIEEYGVIPVYPNQHLERYEDFI